MSGGFPEADRMNGDLARAARRLGLGLGVGSQRAALEGGKDWPSLREGDDDTLLILGNIGLAQANKYPSEKLAELANGIGADALAVHLNPAQEWFQTGGDRNFGESIETLARLSSELPMPLVVKETGCGISRSTASRIMKAGVRHIDVAGAGGTTWVGVELDRRAGAPEWSRAFREWGIPTAASLASAAEIGFETLIASGGIYGGLDAAKALAMGAHAAGIARPVLNAWTENGIEGVEKLLNGMIGSLRAAMALSGARTPGELAGRFVVTGTKLPAWIEAMGRSSV
jgi:isopentenyl-diphosphate delta-isomerase